MEEEFSHNFDEQTLDYLEDILRGHWGKEDAITAGEISELLEKEEGVTSPSTRAAIKHIVRERKLPVASCSKGYFVIRNDDELKEYIENLESRMQGIQTRIDAVKEAYFNE